MTEAAYLPPVTLPAEVERKLFLAWRAELGYPGHAWHKLSAIPDGFTARVARRALLYLLADASDSDMLADIERAADLYRSFFDAIAAKQAAETAYNLTGKSTSKAAATAALLSSIDLTSL